MYSFALQREGEGSIYYLVLILTAKCQITLRLLILFYVKFQTGLRSKAEALQHRFTSHDESEIYNQKTKVYREASLWNKQKKTKFERINNEQSGICMEKSQ